MVQSVQAFLYKLMTTTAAASMVVFLFGVGNVYSQSTVVEWIFTSEDRAATGGTAENIGNLISRDAGFSGTYSWFGSNELATNSWDGGANSKYWIVSFSSENFQNLTLSSKQRGTNTSPKDWKIQYSVNGGENWFDVADSDYVVANDNYITGVHENLELPSAVDDQSEVQIRWIITSNTSIGDGTTAGGGNSRIIDIVVKGAPTTTELIASPTTLTSFHYGETFGPSAAQSFEVSGANLDGSDVTATAPSNFEVADAEAGTYSPTVTLTAFDGTTTDIWVRMEAGLTDNVYSGNVTISGGGADPVNVSVTGDVAAPKTTVLPYSEDFSTDIGDIYVFSVSGSDREWARHSGEYIFINGFNTGDIEDDWFVIPGVDLDAVDTPVLSFDSWFRFGSDDEDNFLKLWYSTDYAGVDDPNNANWTELSFTKPSGEQSWTGSGAVELSAITGDNVFIAFQYHYEPGSYREWRIDNILIEDVIDPELAVSPTSLSGFEYAEGSGPSSAKSFEVSGLNLDGTDVTVTAPADFEVSETEEGTFGGIVTLTEFDGSSEVVWVRLSSGLDIDTYAGNVVVSGGGADPLNVAVSGEVTVDYDFVESFENFPESSASYNSGSFEGVTGNTWNYINARGSPTIEAPTPGLQNNTDASLNTVISGGVSVFSFDYMQMFSTNVNLEVHINDQLVATVTSDSEANIVKNSGIIEVAYLGDFEIEFKQGSGGGQVAVDNFSWVSYDHGEVTLTGNAGFRMLSTPAVSSLEDFLSPIWTQGATGADFAGGDPNVFNWNTGSGEWSGVTDLTATNVTTGTGVLVYVFDKDDHDDPESNVWPKTLSVSGAENAVNASPAVNSSGNGFTLLGNPFSTTIDFNDVVRDDLTDVAYVWDPTAGGAGAYVSYETDGGLGDLTDGLIAPFQGFFVQTLEEPVGTPGVTFGEASKSTGAGFRGKVAGDERSIVRFELNGEELSSSAWLRFSENGSLESRVQGDALKMDPLSSRYALLATQKLDEQLYDISHLPVADESYSFPVHISSTDGGIYTLTATDFEIPEEFELTFNDHANNTSVQIDLNFEYTVELQAAKAKQNLTPLEKIQHGPVAAKADEDAPQYTITVSSGDAVSIDEPETGLPQRIALNQNYPNPFNPSTVISYELPQASDVTIQVYDMTGRHVATLVNTRMEAGAHEVTFNAGSFASGVYIYRLRAGSHVLTRKLTLIK